MASSSPTKRRTGSKPRRMGKELSNERNPSITITPVFVADLLAEGERMPVDGEFELLPGIRLVPVPGAYARHASGRRRDRRASGRNLR